MTFSKGSSSSSTSEQAETMYPQWQQNALQGLVGTGAAMNAPFLNVPKYGVSGLNVDQMKAFDLARQSAKQAYMGGKPEVQGPTTMDPASVNAAQISGDAIKAQMNPYLKQVMTPAVDQAWQNRQRTQADIGARAAAAGAFGGSREALQRGQADKTFMQDTTQLVASLMAQGYDRASAIAQANAQMQQQANLTNADYQQDANRTNLAYGLESARLEDAMRSNDQQRQLSALQQLLGVGNQQQLFGQAVLDYPFTALQRLTGVVPKNLNSQTNTESQTESENSSGEVNVLGILGSLFSG